MRMTLLVIAASVLAGSAAQAKDNPNAMAAGRDALDRQGPPAAKMLYICSEEELSWRAFSRDLGTPEFVTAQQVRADKSKAWAEPKCITESEARRLAKLAPAN